MMCHSKHWQATSHSRSARALVGTPAEARGEFSHPLHDLASSGSSQCQSGCACKFAGLLWRQPTAAIFQHAELLDTGPETLLTQGEFCRGGNIDLGTVETEAVCFSARSRCAICCASSNPWQALGGGVAALATGNSFQSLENRCVRKDNN